MTRRHPAGALASSPGNSHSTAKHLAYHIKTVTNLRQFHLWGQERRFRKGFLSRKSEVRSKSMRLRFAPAIWLIKHCSLGSLGIPHANICFELFCCFLRANKNKSTLFQRPWLTQVDDHFGGRKSDGFGLENFFLIEVESWKTHFFHSRILCCLNGILWTSPEGKWLQVQVGYPLVIMTLERPLLSIDCLRNGIASASFYFIETSVSNFKPRDCLQMLKKLLYLQHGARNLSFPRELEKTTCKFTTEPSMLFSRFSF